MTTSTGGKIDLAFLTLELVIDIAGVLMLMILGMAGTCLLILLVVWMWCQAYRWTGNLLFDLYCARGWTWCLRVLLLIAWVRHRRRFDKRRWLRMAWRFRRWRREPAPGI